MNPRVSISSAGSSPSSRYLRNSPICLSIHEKERGLSVGGGSFSIKKVDSDRQKFIIEYSKLSASRQVQLFDSMKNLLLTAQGSLITVRDRKTIRYPSGKKAYVLRRKTSDARVIKVWDCQQQNEDVDEPMYRIFGNYENKNYEVFQVDTGQVVASARRRVLVVKDSHVFLEKHNYVLTIEPGTNVALMTIIAVAIDEHHRVWP